MDYNDPRGKGRKAVEETVPAEVWKKNRQFSEKLKALLVKHPLASHPLIEFLENEESSKKVQKIVHLEFGYAFAQIFTDAVVKAMFNCKDLEPRLGPKGKVSARFLWAINLMDEIGYIPSSDGENYAGNPYAAHYYQYIQVFMSMGEDEKAILSYKPTDEAKDARRTFENQYSDYAKLATVLAMSESIFDKFAGPWANNVGRSTEVDVSQGYHTIHVEDDHGDSIDDDHSEDGWTLFCQAITPDRYDEVEEEVRKWLDCWCQFADKLLDLIMESE